jgi:hypothetical protein
MTELSPSAKIILAASAKANCLQEWDHVNDPPCHPGDSDWNGCYTCVHRAGIAAALRAAVDQVVPEHREHYPATLDERYRKVSAFDVRSKFFAIAAELEAQ